MRPSKVKLLGVAVLLFHNFVIFTAVEHKSVVGKHFFTECRPNVALIRGFYIHAVNIPQPSYHAFTALYVHLTRFKPISSY